MKGEMAMLGSAVRLLGVWETIPAFPDTFGAHIAQRVCLKESTQSDK